MIKVSFSSPVWFHTGTIGLDERQVKVRSQRLKEIGKGLYEILEPVQFKAGERVMIDEVPKSYIGLLDDESKKSMMEDKTAALEPDMRAAEKASEEMEVELAGKTKKVQKPKGRAPKKS